MHHPGIILRAVGFVVVVGACSSADDPDDEASVPTADAGADASNEVDAPAPNACGRDGQGVAEDDSETCCEGLFKGCTGLSIGDQKPCVCSTVECGTVDAPPPPGVPCCATSAGNDCTQRYGDPFAQCKCG